MYPILYFCILSFFSPILISLIYHPPQSYEQMLSSGHCLGKHLTNSLKIFQLCVNVCISVNDLLIHSVTLPNLYFVCLLFFCLRWYLRLFALMMYLYRFNFLFLRIVMRSTNGPVSCWRVSWTVSFVV